MRALDKGNKVLLRIKSAAERAKCQTRKKCQEFWEDESGIGVVEVILILVVLIGLVIIFKSQITSLVNTIFQKITSESSTI